MERVSSKSDSHILTSHRSVWRTCMIVLVMVNAALAMTANGVRIKGRKNVCAHTRYVTRPVHTRQTYRRPIQVTDFARCAHEEESPCNRTRTSYQQAHRYVVKLQVRTQLMPSCCPGWKQRSPEDADCLEPQCSQECQNGGECAGAEICQCPEGYAGQYCQTDIDECSGRNSCQQKCINLPGTYECACSQGFKLADDEGSCELCLSCTPEFQALEARVESLPGELAFIAEDDEKKKKEEDARNIQADMVAEMRRQAETFDKLQSQYDSIQELRKKMDVIPEISGRLDNLTRLDVKVTTLKTIEPRVTNLEERFDEGLADMKASHTELSGAMEATEQRWQTIMVTSSQHQSSAVDSLQQQMDKMAVRIDTLEQERVDLQAKLTSALDQYEGAVNTLNEKREATPQAPATTVNPYGAEQGGSGGLMPMDRLASLSQQISILEERMSECMCNQNYFG